MNFIGNMKNKELIKLLSKYPADLDVIVDDNTYEEGKEIEKVRVGNIITTKGLMSKIIIEIEYEA